MKIYVYGEYKFYRGRTVRLFVVLLGSVVIANKVRGL